MWRSVLLGVVLAGVLAGCSLGGGSGAGRFSRPLPVGAGYAAYCGDSGCPRQGVPDALLRPLHLPHVASGAACPTAAAPRRVTDSLGPMVGGGPAYAISAFAHGTVLPFAYPPPKSSVFAGSAWGGEKVFWAVSPGYHGPVLVRGGQLDGTAQIGFGTSKVPYSQLEFQPSRGDPSLGGWRGYPALTRLHQQGCYGWQIDGTTFSEVIVFKAVIGPT